MTDEPSPSPNPAIPRRRFVQLAAGGLGAVLASYAFYRLVSDEDDDPAGAAGGLTTDPDRDGYGALVAGDGILAMPPGFQYRELSIDSQRMSDGLPTPAAPDGMAAFAGAGGMIHLVRNHELDGRSDDGPPPAYDLRAAGGTTTLVIDPEQRIVLRDGVSLAGTARNCAGGATPWGSWLTCEETTAGLGDGYLKRHGYVFEVHADATAPIEARPLIGLGRFRHEAVAVDAANGVVYETEDAEPEAGLYRFVVGDRPGATNERLDLTSDGRLQALAVVDEPGIDLRTVVAGGTSYPIAWVDIETPDADIEGGQTVMGQALDNGAARFRRLEGCAMEGASVWFTSTDGGRGHGQIWRLDPGGDVLSGGTLTMVYASPSGEVLDGPDNLVLSPQGALVICEDNSRGVNRLVALGANGLLVPLAANIDNDQEFAGATFSPDGQTLFVNAQGDTGRGITGRTLAIWGPWENGII